MQYDLLSGADAMLERLRDTTARGGRLVLSGPEGPDGDSIGACLALQQLLQAIVPDAKVDVVGAVPPRYRTLPGAAGVLPNAAAQDATGVIVLDGDKHRLPEPVRAAFDRADWTGLVDHHISSGVAGYDVAILDAKAESTCGMVARFAKHWGIPLQQDLAELIYAGMVFDTGAFRYSNTGPSTHRLAADLLETGFDHSAVVIRTLVERSPASLRLMAQVCAGARFVAGGRGLVGEVGLDALRMAGAKEIDLDGVVDILQHIEGVEVAALVTERPQKAKVSLRSRGRVNVADVAKRLDSAGGGHAKAAGVVMPMTDWDAAVERVVAIVCDALDRAPHV